MALRRAWIAAALALSCASPSPVPKTSTAVPPAQVLRIDKVGVEPKELRYGEGTGTAVRFELSREASAVSVEIADEVGRPIRSLDLGARAAGPVSVSWDGRDSQGKPVPSGVYLYGITASDSAGTTRSENAVPGGNEVLVQQFTLDPDSGTMRFLLPQASRIRLRVGLRGYPLLRTLYDWVPMAAGPHEVTWDGLDTTGKLHLLGKSALDVNLTAFALPGNAILVTSNAAPPAPIAGLRPDVPQDAFRHAKHPLELCHEPKLSLELPEARAKGKSGLPLVSGKVPVRITLDPADAAHLIDARFEIMLFVDTVFLTEAEEGSNPFTYQLDTSALAPGTHLFTVNVLSYDDHAGTATIEFERREMGKNHGE